MNNHLIKSFLILSCILLIILTIFFLRERKSSELLQEEIVKLKTEKISVLSDYEGCLKQKEKVLKKELLNKYIQSIMSMVNKIEEGQKPSKEDVSSFIDRADFIVDNMQSVDVSQEEAKQYLLFLSSAKKTFEPFLNTYKQN